MIVQLHRLIVYNNKPDARQVYAQLHAHQAVPAHLPGSVRLRAGERRGARLQGGRHHHPQAESG